MSARTRGTRAMLLLALGAGSCSTLADTLAPEECRSDAECPEGEVCAVDQGRCLPGNEAAPRAHLGFDIREKAAAKVLFRVEVDGCDCTIDEEANIRELALQRSRVSQEFLLEVKGETGDPMPPPDGLLAARFYLTQPSRHGLSPSPQAGDAPHPTIAANGESVIDTVLQWPRYHPDDINVPPELVLWLIDPDGQSLATRYLGIVPRAPCETNADCCEPKGDCDPAPNFCDTSVGECTAVGQPTWIYRYDYAEDCSRGLEGDVTLLDMDGDPFVTGAPVDMATVRVRYSDDLTQRLGIPVLGELAAADRPPECNDDDDCDTPDQYCDQASSQCFVALAGRFADGGSSTDVSGTFRTQVYTYCEGVDPSVPLARRYEITVQPQGPRPTVDYVVDAAFNPSSQGESSFRVAKDLCVPDWGPGATLEVAVAGQPRTLVDGSEYTCCDLGCLPSSADEAADAGPPPVPELCDSRTSTGAPSAIRFEAPFVLEDLEAWDNADCVTPNLDPQGRVGSLVRSAVCDNAPGATCSVTDLALGTPTTPRRYQVRVESEVGSVLASGDFELELGPEAPETHTLTLSPRVLVTGVVDVDDVICGRRDPGEDCAAREAVVLAERLRLPSEPPGSVPGPYFHSVSTFYDPIAKRDGAFVLPLDPGGVYVLTALPPTGAEGGPAGYTLVDLRPDAPEPLAPVKLVLEDGVVVTLRLDQFDPRTTVAPVDRGSYLVPGRTLQLPVEGSEMINLNEIGACWTAENAPLGCQIRRLIPPGSDLARSQVGVVRFTARRSDQAGCAVECPSSSPS